MVALENQVSAADDSGAVAVPAAAVVELATGDSEDAQRAHAGATTTVTPAALLSDMATGAVATADAGELLHVRLKLLDERVVEVAAPPAMSVADFRVKVAHATDVPVHRQRLIYRGKLMKDGSALSTYDIQDGHTVHLVAKPVQSAASSRSAGGSSDAPTSNVNANANGDTAGTRSTGPRFTFANRSDDDDFVGSAVRRNREYLRRLMSTEDALDREDAESESAGRRSLREPSATRPQTVTRRRVPGPGEPTGTAWNMGVLREALGGESAASESRDESVPRLHGLRELFGDDVLDDASPTSAASEMGLGPSVLNAGSSASEPRANLDHIIQGMMTLRTVLSTVAAEAEPEQFSDQVAHSEVEEELEFEDEDTFLPNQPATPRSTGAGARSRLRRAPRRFFVGQWLDVKDTVNQWLECTVMDILEDKILVHYHGWPSRWDEWIDFDSSRIAAFRTRTVHAVNSQHMSPMPLTRLPNAPSIGNPDVREMVSGVRDLMREIMPHVERFADLCEAQAGAHSQQGARSTGDADAARDGAVHSAASHTDDISEMAHLIAPVFDRVGRLLADSARSLEPLLRPELQNYNRQRQAEQLRAAAARNRTTRQQGPAPTALEREDSSLSIRDLISTTMVNPNEAQGGRRNIDVHIHAIVAPSSLTSLASLARAASNASILQATNATANRRARAPLSPPASSSFEESFAFGLPNLREPLGNSDGRALVNDEADDDEHDTDRGNVDNSRMPLLSSFRRQDRRDFSSTADARRRRTVDQNLENFLSDDFFGTSFGNEEHEHEHELDNDAAAPANSRSPAAATRGGRFEYQSIPSPLSPFEEAAQRDGDSHSDAVLGVIPEVAEANDRARSRDGENATAARSAAGNVQEMDRANERARGDSSASSSSSSSSSSNASSYPSFLEFMRRSLSRNFGFSSTSERRQSDNGEDDIPTLEPLSSSIVSSSSSSSASRSSFPSSPSVGRGDIQLRSRRLSSSSSSIEEEEMDQVD